MFEMLKTSVAKGLNSQLQVERTARKKAELELKKKAAELQEANEVLLHLNQNLELEIANRTAALEESERRYRQIIDTAADLIYRTDHNGFFTYINTFASNKFGYKPENIVGRHFAEFVHPDYVQEVLMFYYEIRRTMQERSYHEFPAISKSGKTIWIGQNIQLIIEDNRVKEITSVARDISTQVEAKKALKTTQIRLSTLIKNLQSAVVVEDEQGKILLANQRFINLFHLSDSPDSIVGHACSEIMQSISSLFQQPHQFIAKTHSQTKNQTPVINQEFVLREGSILERDYIPISVDNKYLGHLWNFRDVTDKRNREQSLRRSEEKYRGILENMQLGLIELDLDYQIVRAYDLFCEMTGFSQEELVGKHALDTFLPKEYADVFWYTKNKLAKKDTVNEVRIRRRDGTLIWALLSGAPIYSEKGKTCGSVGVYYDITERKELQQELALAKSRAEEAQEVEQQFLARMSHEIRTPLNAIIGMAHLLNDTSPNEEQLEYLSVVKGSADLLLGIITNILDFSKIQSGEFKLKKKTFDLGALILFLQQTFQQKAKDQKKNIKVKAEVDPKINSLLIGDDLVLNQILVNLLSNALKFTSEGDIGIRVQQINYEHGSRLLEFTVHDSGIGIPKDQINHIFEDFKQLQEESEEFFGGTGLGLTIINKFIALQNGKIWVNSNQGEGSHFIFRLSYKDSGVSTIQATKELHDSNNTLQSSFRILVVEDNPMNCKYVGSLLEKWNIKADNAKNGKEAVEMTLQEKYSLILMDISMPIMDGFAATESIRSTSNPNQLTPIIALTASALISTKEKAFEVGMSDFLTKPFKPYQLQEVIQKYDLGKAPTKDNEKDFQFNNILDVDFLKEVYDDDIEYAADIFDIFLNHSLQDIAQLSIYIENEDWDPLGDLAHKIKPTFSMVGLTNLETKMLQIEKSARNEKNIEDIRAIYSEIDEILQQTIPVLEEELRKMREKLKVV
ncbi:MAG: PAS domain S-box protein [Saprospiraceae bacterium]|nr:PAS domain S-box protein [Saprospiraceae bacterium]